MINKKAEGESMGWLVNLIIIVIVIIVAGGGMFLFLKYEAWKILPGFGDENKSVDDIVVEEGVVEFDEPWKARYLIKGRDAQKIYYNCNEVEGWKWYYEKIEKWWKVSSTESVYFKELSIKNQKFIESLQGLDCEEGLGVLVDRIKENDEGRNWGFKSQVGLKIFVNNENVFYASGNEIFEDIRFLIKKINRIGKDE